MFLDALQINSTQNNVNSVAFLLVFFECWEDSSLHYEVPNASTKIKVTRFCDKKKLKNFGASKQSLRSIIIIYLQTGDNLLWKYYYSRYIVDTILFLCCVVVIC